MKALQLCLEISKIPNRSQLVVDDLYNPYTGFVNASFTFNPDLMTYLLLKIVLTRITSFVPRDIKKEEEIKQLIIEQYNNFSEFFLNTLGTRVNVNSDVLTDSEKRLFFTIIDRPIARASILRETAKTKPEYVKALSPRPEDKFALIAYIHDGFRKKQILLDILWEELCTLPYVLDYSK